MVVSLLQVQFREYRGSRQLDEQVLHVGEREAFWDDGVVETPEVLS